MIEKLVLYCNSSKVTELLMDCTKIKNLGFVPQYSSMNELLDELIHE